MQYHILQRLKQGKQTSVCAL